MTTFEQNLINATKGVHNNQPNKVSDSKLTDVEQRLIEIKSALGDSGETVNPYVSSKQPYPARIMPNEVNGYRVYPNSAEKRYRAIDSDGNVYATTWNSVQKLHVDQIATATNGDWEVLWQPDTTVTGQINVSALIVTKTNRVVMCTQFAHVYVSDENQQNFSDTGVRFPFNNETGDGYTHFQFGYGQYENLVWVSGYGKKPTHSGVIYLSRDYGETWEQLADIPRVTDAYNSHIHDVQYDPYDDRFWVVFGDQVNCNIFYSDDYGETWLKVFNDFSDTRNTQLTSLSFYPHGVVFGSDHATSSEYPNNDMEDSIRYWKRPKGQRQAIVDPADIRIIYRPYNDSVFRSFAMKSWQGRVGENILTLIPWYGIGEDPTFLTASIDGLNWYEIYRGERPGSFQIAGVYNNRIIGFDYDEQGRICLLDMPVPDWI